MSNIAFFDLDGTVVDSRIDVAHGHCHAVTSVGGIAPPLDEVVSLIGLSLEKTYEIMLPQSLHHRIPEAAENYKTFYFDHCADNSRPFEGAREGIERLREAGFKTAIATTKRSFMAVRVLEQLGLTDLFDHIQGTEDFPHKPQPDIIWHCLSALNIPRSSGTMWMVGDTTMDIRAGHNAGINSAAALYGYGENEELHNLRPQVAAASFDELIEGILTWNESD